MLKISPKIRLRMLINVMLIKKICNLCVVSCKTSKSTSSYRIFMVEFHAAVVILAFLIMTTLSC